MTPEEISKAAEILQRHCDKPIDGVGVYDTGFTKRDISRQVINAMEEYAALKTKALEEQIQQLKSQQYDFSKSCQCDSSPGQTWCCNQCGLPAIKTINKPQP